jgi:SAM-dependent methyltransferase
MPLISKRSGTDRRADLLPPELLPLFGDGFVGSWDLLGEYVARLACTILRTTGLDREFDQETTVSDAIARAGLDASVAAVPTRWLAETLAGRGWMAKVAAEGEETAYRLPKPFTALDAAQVEVAQEAHDATCLPSYTIAAMAAEHYPAVLRGETTGEQALFGPEGISAWVKYFSNANPLYAISNRVGAIAVEQAWAGDGAILELGGGLGSGAQALLEQLQQSGRKIARYRFTEVSALFMKRAERVLSRWREACGIDFTPLDIDHPFAEAGVMPGEHAVVYAVNVLHVARDLAATLREVRTSLKPHGALVISECVRPFAGVPLPVELAFNLLKSFREPLLVPAWRPNGGFLTPEQWTLALQSNGFTDVRVFPDIAAIRDDYPTFAVAAIVARRE